MQLTRAADYAVRVMVHLASLPPNARLTRDELSAFGEVPEHFLSKILQALSRSGLIASYRGVGGGYALSKPPDSVTLLDVVETIEGPIQLNLCLAPGPSCDRKNWCSVHRVWVEAQQALTAVLRDATIARLAGEAAVNKDICGAPAWN